MTTFSIKVNGVFEIDSNGNEIPYVEDPQYVACWTDGRTNKEIYRTDYTMTKEEAETLAEKVLKTKMKSRAPKNAPHKAWIEKV